MAWRNLRVKPGLAFLLCMLCYHFFTASITHAQSGGLPQAGSMISVDYKSLISKADLDFNERLGGPKAERGLPIGNGRMGTLLWTAPEQSKLHMQVNHTDVFAFRNSSASTRRDRGAPGQAFYCNGCGFVDIDLGEDVFTETAVRNHLAVYDAVAEVGFLVSSSMKGGTIRFVEILSQLGGQCRIRNPWPSATTTLFCDGKKMDEMKGPLLKFPTEKGKSYLLVSPLCWNANAASKAAAPSGLGGIEELRTVVQ